MKSISDLIWEPEMEITPLDIGIADCNPLELSCAGSGSSGLPFVFQEGHIKYPPMC